MTDEMTISSLLRAAADGELTPAQQARLDAHLAAHPEDASRIEFERRLRDATARAMGAVTTPAGLRDRVESAMVEEDVAPIPMRRSPRLLGLAAGVLLVIGAAALLIAPNSPIGPQARYQAGLVSYLDREHVRCWVDTDEILDKFNVREADSLPTQAEALLGVRVEVDELVDDLQGLDFLGAGECAAPGRTPSMHLGFKTNGEAGEAGVAVSLFVQVDHGRLELADGVTYRLTSERRLARGVCTIYVWTRDGLLHFLVSDDAEACDLGRTSLGAPERVEQL